MQRIKRLALSGLLISALALAFGISNVRATDMMEAAPTSTTTETATIPADTETAPPAPSVAPTATATIPSINRPLLLTTYSLPKKGVSIDNDFKLSLSFTNQGGADAYNIIVTLQGENLIPRGNGGVQAINRIAAGENSGLSQSMYASKVLAGQTSATLNVSVSYSDENGIPYTTSLVLLINFNATTATSSGSWSAAATNTPTPAPRSKLIIGSYKTDLEKLQAGTLFKLNLNIKNQGNSAARNVTMVLGGATISADGTPSAGGVSGGGADLSKFAPMGSSNLYFLGDIPSGENISQTIPLVVNVATEPGVYTLKISFVYEDTANGRLLDDQVITLLIYELPKLSASFYQDVPDFSVGEFRPLPIQITNIGRKPTVLGDIIVNASSGQIGKNKATIGTIETGGYFTIDADYTADTPGPVTLTIQINYTDDFQEAGLIEKTITFNTIDAPIFPPDGGAEGGGVLPPVVEESLWDKVLKAVLGFLGFSGG